MGGCKHGWIDLAARRRRDHDDPGNTCNLCRNGVHEHGAWIARLPARDIKADGVDRCPAMAQLRPDGIGVTLIRGEMAAMMRLNTLMREGERRLQIRRKRSVGRFKLFR